MIDRAGWTGKTRKGWFGQLQAENRLGIGEGEETRWVTINAAVFAQIVSSMQVLEMRLEHEISRSQRLLERAVEAEKQGANEASNLRVAEEELRRFRTRQASVSKPTPRAYAEATANPDLLPAMHLQSQLSAMDVDEELARKNLKKLSDDATSPQPAPAPEPYSPPVSSHSSRDCDSYSSSSSSSSSDSSSSSSDSSCSSSSSE